jgi:hypothetical protein
MTTRILPSHANGPSLQDKIRSLACQGLTACQIAEKLNAEKGATSSPHWRRYLHAYAQHVLDARA